VNLGISVKRSVMGELVNVIVTGGLENHKAGEDGTRKVISIWFQGRKKKGVRRLHQKRGYVTRVLRFNKIKLQLASEKDKCR